MARTQAESIVEAHRAYRELGRRVEALMKRERLSKAEAAARLARVEGTSADRAEKALEFALAFRSDADLRRLGRIRVAVTRGSGVTSHAGGGPTLVPLSERVLRRLGLGDPEEREAALDYLEGDRATAKGLEALLRRRKRRAPAGGQGGRRPEPARDADEALDQVERLCRAWLRACAANWADVDGQRPAWQARAQVRGRKVRLRAAATLLGEVRAQAEALEQRLAELAQGK